MRYCNACLRLWRAGWLNSFKTSIPPEKGPTVKHTQTDWWVKINPDTLSAWCHDVTWLYEIFRDLTCCIRKLHLAASAWSCILTFPLNPSSVWCVCTRARGLCFYTKIFLTEALNCPRAQLILSATTLFHLR